MTAYSGRTFSTTGADCGQMLINCHIGSGINQGKDHGMHGNGHAAIGHSQH